MALFRPEDVKRQNIDVMTQMYQVDERDDAEVSQWINDIGFDVESNDPFIDDDDEEREIVQRVTLVQRYINLARRIMGTIADHGAMRRADIIELNAAISDMNERSPERFTLSAIDALMHDPSQLFPLEQVRFARRNDDVVDFCVARIKQLVIDCLPYLFSPANPKTEGTQALSRCPICNSVFLVGRSGQVFCSERCGSRDRMRRSREKMRLQRANASLPEGDTVLRN